MRYEYHGWALGFLISLIFAFNVEFESAANAFIITFCLTVVLCFLGLAGGKALEDWVRLRRHKCSRKE